MSTDLVVKNPFENEGDLATVEPQSLASIQAEHTALAEVQGRMMVAMARPRNEYQATNAILKTCERFALADIAMYSYPRGNTQVEGPSIRLAEVMAQAWGHVDFGFKVVSQDAKGSNVVAFCWDIQTNTKSVREFYVSHEKKASGRVKTLTDPRDIYEHVANMAMRRVRSCILQIIPRDVQDAAVKQVRETIAKGDGNHSLEEVKTRMIKTFDNIGVSIGDLENYLGIPMDKVRADEVVTLKGIITAIRNGYSKHEYFGTPDVRSDANDRFKLENEKAGEEE